MASGYIGGVFDSAVFDCAVFDCGTLVDIEDKKFTGKSSDDRLFQQILREDDEILEFILTVVTSGILEK